MNFSFTYTKLHDIFVKFIFVVSFDAMLQCNSNLLPHVGGQSLEFGCSWKMGAGSLINPFPYYCKMKIPAEGRRHVWVSVSERCYPIRVVPAGPCSGGLIGCRPWAVDHGGRVAQSSIVPAFALGAATAGTATVTVP